jgi:5'-nucleotidase
MRILLSNDDGIYAGGLKALKDILSPLGDIYIAAPDRERSATGHGITVHTPLRPRKISMENVIEAWSIDGTPADCVKLGIEALIPETPDILVAGINWGANLGTDVLYSGTVSAAIEGLINDIPSVAVSLATRNEPDYYRAEQFIKEIIMRIYDHGLPKDCLCNINIPEGEPKGIKVTSLGRRKYENIFEKRCDPRGQPYYWMGGRPRDEEPPMGCSDFMTDTRAIKEGYISITPVHFDLTDYNSLQQFCRWFSTKETD